MRRKVIQQGPSTLMVSLPSKWVKENNVKKGDEITLDVTNNQLVLYTEQKQEKKTEVRIDRREEYLDRILMNKYRQGYNEVIVYYKDPDVIDDIKGTLRYLLGFEIVDQTAASCTIKNISEGSDENYEVMFRRLFQIMLTMAESCLEYAETKDDKKRKAAIDLRETLIKLEQFNLRLINKETSFSLQKKSLEYFYVWNIATFGKIWASFARKPLSENPTFSKEDISFLKEVVQYTRDFYSTFYKRDRKNLLDLKKRLYSLRPVGRERLEKSENTFIMFYLLRIINRFYEISLTF